ncbi:hypothetical protein FHS72_003297 [Loktanella ponticola]|uniref:Uncharacterized protein n=1 Tax=Yoonia ponticola TaxID=1524255 RepID=A0A7W9EZC0_9RHOB|nr:hypothetical protein [Yoonia ponticola]MBB5723652.1 hypothetical protein [Yoonia ponticola]
MIGLTVALPFLSSGGASVSGDAAPAPPPTLPIAVTTRWHPAHSTVTLDGDRVTAASDLAGLAHASAPTGAGPTAKIDALGRPFWRFEGDSYLEIADALTLTSRDMSVFFVGRFHQVVTRSPVFSLGRADGVAPNTIQSALETSVEGSSVPALRTYSYPRNSSYTDMAKMVTGSQMQVVGMVGRGNAAGGSRLWLNADRITVQQPYLVSDVAGAEIGRYAYRPDDSGTWGRFDLYEMIVLDNAVTDLDGDALVADLMTTYGIVPAVNQLVLEGDSIMRGTDPVTSGLCPNMVLTDPGAGLLGPDWRVLNVASTGAAIAKVIERRDAPDGWITTPLSGTNVLAFELGRNDMAAGGQSPAIHYANVVDYLTDDVSGTGQSVLAHGWDIRALVNIASATSLEADINAYRALLRDPAFAIDTQTEAGGAYAGQLQLVETDLITVGGDPVFASASDASDLTYYAGDNTHPSIIGSAVRVTGGDNPAHGIAYGL